MNRSLPHDSKNILIKQIYNTLGTESCKKNYTVQSIGMKGTLDANIGCYIQIYPKFPNILYIYATNIT